MGKVIQQITCSKCSNVIRNEIELDEIFKQIQKKVPGTKGPIDSIRALLNNQKP